MKIKMKATKLYLNKIRKTGQNLILEVELAVTGDHALTLKLDLKC